MKKIDKDISKDTIKEPKKKAGRPSKWKEEYIDLVYKLCLLGLRDSDLAKLFDVSEQTLDTWKKQHPLFFESIKNGRVIADGEVVVSFRQRANGYRWTEQQAIKCRDIEYKDGKRIAERERVEIVDIERFVPPDPTCGIFWLKNRQPKYWRDKVAVENTVPSVDDTLNQIADGLIARDVK